MRTVELHRRERDRARASEDEAWAVCASLRDDAERLHRQLRDLVDAVIAEHCPECDCQLCVYARDVLMGEG